MINRFVCSNCRRNILNDELTSAKIARTRYDGKIHTFCPYCDTHIISFSYDEYDKVINNLSKSFIDFGCRIVCYYEGNIEQGENAIEYKPPIFRITDTNDRLFYKLACKIKHVNEIELDDIFIVDENDNSFSIIGGAETWYFDIDSANNDRNKYLVIIKNLIDMLIICGNKYINMGYNNE